MSSPGVGFEFPPVPVSWLKRDVLLFASSIGCDADELHFTYELHPDFCVFPTYANILPFKGTTQEVIDFYASQKAIAIPHAPPLDARRVLDGQRHMRFLRPLPTSSDGRHFELRTRVLGLYDKGRPGTVLETQTDVVDADTNDVYCSTITSTFYVGQGNWGGAKGPAAPNYPPPANRASSPDLTFSDQTSALTPLLYRLNGDYNPLHATPEPGRKMGFGGAIVHGLYSFNSTAHLLLRHLGQGRPENMREYQARFVSPVRPGDRLDTAVWRTGQVDGDGFEEVRFQTSIKGKVCLSNGRALIKTGGGGESKL